MPETTPHDRIVPDEIEARLRQREADLARVQRIGQVGGLDIDVVGGMRSFRSPEYLRLHGLPPDRQEETHEQWRDRVHPQDRDHAEQTLVAALSSTSDSYDSEYRIVRPSDGEVRWIHARADIERDSAGKAVRLVGAHVDVTEQKQMQAALRESEARQSAMLKVLPLGLGLAGLDGKILLSNPEWARYIPTGTIPSRDDGRGWRWRAWDRDGKPLDPSDYPAARALRGETVDPPLTFLYQDDSGREQWTSVASVPVTDAGGTITGAVSIIQNVDAAKRAEQALRESEERLAKLLTLMPAAVYTCDAEGRINFYNQRAAELWGREPKLGDPQERFCGSFRMWRPDGTLMRHEDCPMADAVQQGRSGRDLEVVIERPDRSRIVANVNIDPLYDPGGELVGAINVFTDVTERRKADASLRANEAWLEAEKEAFQAAMNGAALDVSLGILLDAAAVQAGDGRRFAFYRVTAKGNELSHVVGMPEDYAEAVEGFAISPESLACGLAVARGEPVVTPDVLGEPRWKPWAWLAEKHGYRGCWSFPVETATGQLVGSFAMYFTEPRKAEPQDYALAARINHAAAIIISRHQENAERIRSEERFRQFAEASSGALWIRSAATLEMEYVSPAISTIYGVEPGELLGPVENWTAMIVPEDRGTAIEHIEQPRQGKSVVHQFRIRRKADGALRWIRNIDFPLRDDGQIPRIGGIAEDVTEAKQATERQSVLLAELQHRVRNVLTVVRSVFNRSVETSESLSELADHFQGRIAALARTQMIVTSNPGGMADLENLLREELLSVGVSDRPGVKMAGPDVGLPPRKAQMFGLAIHELTTNALKYGALSVPSGSLDISWRLDPGCSGSPQLDFTWNESGVPAVPVNPGRIGFGRELIEQALPYQLEGETELEFRSGGIRCRISLPLGDEQPAALPE